MTILEVKNEAAVVRPASLVTRLLLGSLRTFVLTPLMFFNLIMIIFVVVLSAARLRQAGLVSEFDISYLFSFIFENIGIKYEPSVIIKFMLSVSFVISALNTLIRLVIGLKKKRTLYSIAYTSAIVVALWIVIFFLMGGFSIPNLAEGIVVFYIFGGIHLFLNFVYGFSNYLMANNA